MNTNDRIRQFIAYKKLTVQQFEQIVGLGNGTVATISSNSRKPTFVRISERFPELNIDWVKTGEGEMLVSAHADQEPGAGSGEAVTESPPNKQRTSCSCPSAEEFMAQIAALHKMLERSIESNARAIENNTKAIENNEKQNIRFMDMLRELFKMKNG